jgi:hypothetical protein
VRRNEQVLREAYEVVYTYCMRRGFTFEPSITALLSISRPTYSPHAPRLKQPLYSRSPSLAMAIDYFANPPPGLNLNESRTATNNAVGIILFVLSLVFVALRLFTRLRLKRETIGLDDYLMFLGLALNAGNLACCIAGGYYGLGKHIWTLDAYQMRQITIVFTHPRPCA